MKIIFELSNEDNQDIESILSNYEEYEKAIKNLLKEIEKEYIPIQKVKEKIVRIKKLLEQKTSRGDGKSMINLINYTKAIGKLEVLQELLEGK